MSERFVGIDLGAETIKIVELVREDDICNRRLRRGRVELVEHDKEPADALLAALASWDWSLVSGAAVSGRFSRLLRLPRVPTKQAQTHGFRWLFDDQPATVISIGGHGFSVLELRNSGVEVFRENSRCSQGTGNFLRQLVARFDLSIEQASKMCEVVDNPAPLSGRCPVILKTDMTHLANKGECRGRILAGLYDAVCENVQVLVKPGISPRRAMLVGGVSRSRRIRDNFARFLDRNEMELLDTDADNANFIEALGCAALASERSLPVPALNELFAPPQEAHLERIPALSTYLTKVKRMPPQSMTPIAGRERLVLGFDIGSTGSKSVAVDAGRRAVIWEGYISTNGNPVGAAQTLMQQFVDSPAGGGDVVALAATGSGRDIVGSLMSTCYGVDSVFVLNEIAAHAEGALHFDPRVDTIFEIGGQDAKYIRLADGRVIDAAMNEACSAGTGSFIEEQGRKFSGIDNVVQLGNEALCSESGVALGQHCSVFMAEIIDEAVAAGVENRTLITGIYDSIIQNYLNRVKGSRSVGQVVFCQGMPFSADALAAAVVRQTGAEVIIPPNPGTVGALGIALLALKSIPVHERPALEPRKLFEARVKRKDTFICKSTKGCGGAGNGCRIDRITTVVEDRRRRFTWGGGCSLWDRGTGKKKLPDHSPDPFRERQTMIDELVERLGRPRGNKRMALTDEFQLKSLFPFFSTFLYEFGFDLEIATGADQSALKRGIERANVPFCAPMQQFHGLVTAMAEREPDLLFLPMLRSIPKVGDEKSAVVCPIAQGSPDIMRWDLGKSASPQMSIVSPVIDVGPGNLESRAFIESCNRLALSLGVTANGWWPAYQAALETQQSFDAHCHELGREALSFCHKHEILPVVVLGRAYTIYNTVLNANVPAILREQGAIAIPVDCYEVDDSIPVFRDVYWGYGQRNLRAAHQARRTAKLYTLWCSNYACGPDSFNLHFYAYIMEGKPFAIIETDGHSGDAGTKTRVEAFLHCVHEDLEAGMIPATTATAEPAIDGALPVTGHRTCQRANALKQIELDKQLLPDIRRRQQQRVLVPRMGPCAETLAAALRGLGVPAECLPMPDREAVTIGRRYTSGKECLPMVLTLGSLLQRLERDRNTGEEFAFFMPTACGPCRFGVYNVLHKIVLERLDWKARVRIWSPVDRDYFEGLAPGFANVVFAGFIATDMLLEALYDVRPVETRPGAADEIYQRYQREILVTTERATGSNHSVGSAVMNAINGSMFGLADVLRRAGEEFAGIKGKKLLPSVMVVGEIYVRCDPFANDFIVDKLEQRGIRVRFAPFSEWLEYTDHIARAQGLKTGFGAQLSALVQRRIRARGHAVLGAHLGWHKRTTVKNTLSAGVPYVRKDLNGEAVLTVGGPIYEWREGLIDGVVSLGPHECMPNKVSEAQFFHVAEQEGLPSLTIPLNGDPIDPEVIDNFAFEIHSRVACKHSRVSSSRRV